VLALAPRAATAQFEVAPEIPFVPAAGMLALPVTWTDEGAPPGTIAYDVVFDPARVAIFRGEALATVGSSAAALQRGNVRVAQVSPGRARVLATGPVPRSGVHHLLNIDLFPGVTGSLDLTFENMVAYDHDPGNAPELRDIDIDDFSRPISPPDPPVLQVPTIVDDVPVRPGELLRLNPNVLASPNGVAGYLVIEAPANTLEALGVRERGVGARSALISTTTNDGVDTITVLFSSPVDTNSPASVADLPEIELLVTAEAPTAALVRLAIEDTHSGPPHYGSLGTVEQLINLDVVSAEAVVRDLNFPEAPENGYQVNDTVTFSGTIDWPDDIPASLLATALVFDPTKIELLEVTLDANIATGGTARSTTDLATANASGRFDALWIYDSLLRNTPLKVPTDTTLITYTVRIADASVAGRDLQWLFTARDNTQVKTTGALLADGYAFVDWTRLHRDLFSIY
jgi:hypothetical protein